MEYSHVQSGRFHYFFVLLASAFAVLGAGSLGPFRDHGDHGAGIVLLGVALLLALAAAAFARLTVRDRGEHLEVAFGPLPLFRRRVPYASIQSVRKARSDVLDGLGVHYLPGRGWIWNLWGFDCVELELERGRLRVGTDDPDGLVRFIAGRRGG